MTNSVPAPKTLSISVGDLISCGGQTYTISNVSSADNGQGFVVYTCTLSGAGLPLNGTTVACTYANTVISAKSPRNVAGSQINPDTWVVSGAN